MYKYIYKYIYMYIYMYIYLYIYIYTYIYIYIYVPVQGRAAHLTEALPADNTELVELGDHVIVHARLSPKEILHHMQLSPLCMHHPPR